MVFYIIAASEKVNGQQQDPAQVEAKIKGIASFQPRGTQPANQVVRLNIQQDSFKLGSLDQLMALNETTAKMDLLLDKTCKKFEKICFETGSSELLFQDEKDEDKTCKCFLRHLQ